MYYLCLKLQGILWTHLIFQGMVRMRHLCLRFRLIYTVPLLLNERLALPNRLCLLDIVWQAL